MPASIDNGLAALSDVPAFVSARSANTLISENRPTRIQAETLLVLNGLLDELLLLILSSARSLATDRIKSDGMLRVFNNNLLAKDAVLEAELELRSYVEGKRAEGAKVPLGLMATSRLDGSDGFPVQSAYKALRTRCQYYSTFGDCQDDSAAKDQNIMSSDGRPIATVTPGVAIYVTALLDFVGEHILQNVSRVIERDNSDEASLYDLRAAITEDEQLNPLYNKMVIRQELARRIEVLESRRRKLTEDGANRGLRSDARIVKPWHVPTEGDFDEAAGPNLFSAKRASIQQPPRSDNGFSTASSSSRYGHAASSSVGHADSLRGSMSTLRTSSSLANHASDATGTVSPGGSMGKQNGARSSVGLGSMGMRSDGGAASSTGSIGRRQSSERSWSGVFGNMKRRNSFKQGSETPATSGRLLSPTDAGASASHADSALDPDDDFEALMLSGQTMKVSLTPNRLHTIEVAKKGGDVNADLGSLRRRPGTTGMRDDPASAAATYGRGPSPSPTHSSQVSAAGEAPSLHAAGSNERTSTSSTAASDAAIARPSSRASLQTAMRPERRTAAPPPSSYRSPSPALIGKHNLLSREVAEEEAVLSAPTPSSLRRNLPRLQPRDDEAEHSASTAKDLVDLFKSTPPSSTQERFSNFGSDTSSLTDNNTKKSAMSDRVRTLFGRKSSSSTGHHSPSSPHQKTFRTHQRASNKASLEGSQDTYVTSSTTNSMEQSRSLVSPNEGPFNRPAASRPSTSTSEHPAISADAAMEAKLTPDVTVLEPEHAPAGGINGLGMGLAAMAAGGGAAGTAGAMAAARSASYGSRSTSHASQTHSTADGLVADETVPDDASSTSKTKAAEELVSRKVPWGYKRNSTSASTTIERNGTPTSDRRRSVGYQSSNGHGVLPVRGHSNVASSDNGHGAAGGAATWSSSTAIAAAEDIAAPPTMSTGSASRATNAPTAWSGSGGALGGQTLARRGSLGARPSTGNPPRRASGHLETIQLLAELERAMRHCHSVDECRELVRKAMHSDGAPLSASGSRPNGVADENADVSKAEAAPGNAIGAATGGALAAAAAGTAARVAALDADSAKPDIGKGLDSDPHVVKDGQARGPDPSPKIAIFKPTTEGESTSLDQVEQGLVVAWLLGGDDVSDARSDSRSDVRNDADGGEQWVALVKNAEPAASDVSGTKAHPIVDRQASMDSHLSHGDVHGMASSSVVSLQSNYKDAQDEVTVD